MSACWRVDAQMLPLKGEEAREMASEAGLDASRIGGAQWLERWSATLTAVMRR